MLLLKTRLALVAPAGDSTTEAEVINGAITQAGPERRTVSSSSSRRVIGLLRGEVSGLKQERSRKYCPFMFTDLDLLQKSHAISSLFTHEL